MPGRFRASLFLPDLYARHEIESSERAAADTVAGLIDSRLQGVSKERTPKV